MAYISKTARQRRLRGMKERRAYYEKAVEDLLSKARTHLPNYIKDPYFDQIIHDAWYGKTFLYHDEDGDEHETDEPSAEWFEWLTRSYPTLREQYEWVLQNVTVIGASEGALPVSHLAELLLALYDRSHILEEELPGEK